MKKITRIKGAAMVEFALILPLFLVIVFGIIEFGIMLYDKALITNASREAARTAVAFRNPPLSTSTTPSTLSTKAAYAACAYFNLPTNPPTDNSNAAGTSCTANSFLIGFNTSSAAQVATTSVSSTTGSPTGGSLVSGDSKVITTVSYTYNTLVIGRLLNLLTHSNGSSLSSINLSAVSSMIAE